MKRVVGIFGNRVKCVKFASMLFKSKSIQAKKMSQITLFHTTFLPCSHFQGRSWRHFKYQKNVGLYGRPTKKTFWVKDSLKRFQDFNAILSFSIRFQIQFQ